MIDVSSKKPGPFLKWAGGKRWFVERHLNLLPSSYDRYLEPFLGSGAVFFSQPIKKAVLSDLNADLIDTYNALKDRSNEVEQILQAHQRNHDSEYYYEIRSNKPAEIVERAAWFLYLNRTCWNGLYRVNRKNEFNVPRGTKSSVILPSDDFAAVAEFLKASDIAACDFEETIDQAKSDDFVFIDPPYTVKHNLNGFVKYNDCIFSWPDQIRLRDAIVRAYERGVKVLLTNADHESVKNLYEGVGTHLSLSRATVISGAKSGRGMTTELVVRIGY